MSKSCSDGGGRWLELRGERMKSWHRLGGGAEGIGSRIAWQVKGREEARLMLCLGGEGWTVGPGRVRNRSGRRCSI